MFGFTDYKALCHELQGNIDGVTHQNRTLSNKIVAQEIAIEKQKQELAEIKIWTKQLETQNQDLSNTLSTWRSKAKIALDNYTRELEKC